MKLPPDAGTMKNRKTRIVPLHEHIIAQGFIGMVSRSEMERCSTTTKRRNV
jgi:succinyl-CoA synthetase alpha subunit